MPENTSDSIEIVDNADEDLLTRRFNVVCDIARCYNLRTKAVENFMKAAASFCKYADEEFKKHLFAAADNLVDIDYVLKKNKELLEKL